METDKQIIEQVGAALEKEPKINLHRYPLEMQFEDGVLTLDGATESVIARKLALEHAAALPMVTGIVDRMHVVPAETMVDDDICVHLQNSFTQESSFQQCAITTQVDSKTEVVHDPGDELHGKIGVNIENGVVTLDGEVPSLSHKRLSGVMAWWVPGSRDVINGLAVEPPEEDNDDEISDAVRLVMEKDPFVNASQIQVHTKDGVVTLDGMVASESASEMAEFDAWYVFGVDRVINRIQVG